MVTKLSHIQDFQFTIEFDEKNMPKLLVDETPPIGESTGPNPIRLLSAAIGHCISSSLLFCLGKARVKVTGLETTVKTKTGRNKDGRLRVKEIDVLINLCVAGEDEKRVARCLKIFEDYCTVTQSVRNGINVNVKVA